jgi:hypothetical protein
VWPWFSAKNTLCAVSDFAGVVGDGSYGLTIYLKGPARVFTPDNVVICRMRFRPTTWSAN